MMQDFRKIVYGGAGIALGVFIAVFLLDFYPQWEQIRRYEKKIALSLQAAKSLDQSQRKEQAEKFQEELTYWKEAVEILGQSFREVEAKIVADKNIPLITLQIEDLATESQVELISIRPLEARIEKNYEVVPFEIHFQSKYQEMIQFLSALEKQSSVMAVSDIVVKKNASTASGLDVHLTPVVVFMQEQEDG